MQQRVQQNQDQIKGRATGQHWRLSKSYSNFGNELKNARKGVIGERDEGERRGSKKGAQGGFWRSSKNSKEGYVPSYLNTKKRGFAGGDLEVVSRFQA